MITTFTLTCSDYVFAISSDVGIQMKLILRKIMKNEINDTLKGSDDSKYQTKETKNVDQLADLSNLWFILQTSSPDEDETC